jgi:hypothetical protein
MLRLLRIALQVVLFFLLLSIVLAVATPQTGVAEKLLLVAAGIGLIRIAGRVRRVGGSAQPA